MVSRTLLFYVRNVIFYEKIFSFILLIFKLFISFLSVRHLHNERNNKASSPRMLVFISFSTLIFIISRKVSDIASNKINSELEN